jgi:hypothetical protein
MAPVYAIENYEVRGRPGILVTVGAGCPLVGNAPPSVIERRSCKCRGVVTRRAGARWRETIPRMIRHRPAKC